MSKKLEAVLSSHGVEIRPSGKFEILTRCPLCGSADHSHHLAISTRGRGWRCLRNPAQHKGKSYAQLLVYLINCTIERAREMLGEQALAPLPDNDTFASSWRKQLGLETSSERRVDKLVFPPKEFRPLRPSGQRAFSFWEYLRERGFTEEQALWAAENYNLQYALTGRYAYRLVIPVYSATGQLMTWTARALQSDAPIRYLTLDSDSANAPPGDLLLGLSLLFSPKIKARCLVVCEGPFDAIAVSTLGHKLGVWGTCLFGLELSIAQADLLSELDQRFDRMRLLLDASAAFRILNMRARLSRRCKSLQLPRGYKDPGELIEDREGEEFIASLAA